MGENLIKSSVLFVFFALMLAVGYFCRKHTTSVDGFILGSRKAGPWLSAFAYGTSYFSAVVFVGYAGQFGWKYGIAATWAGIANALLGSLLAWAILGRPTRIMTHHLNSATMPQFFEARFKSKAMLYISSALIFIFLIPYTASLYSGLSRLFKMAFGVDYSICVFTIAILTAIYVTAGGYMATVINDFIQGIIMLGGIVVIIAAVLKTQGGFFNAIKALAYVSDPTVSDTPGVFASFFGPDPLNLLAVMILTSLGTWGLPQMVQKFYAINSENAVRKGMVISTVFAAVVSGGCYFLGGFGRLFSDRVDVAVEGYDAIVPAMLSGLPVLLISLVLILVLSASMSTLSSLVLTSSSTLALDFVNNISKRKLKERQLLLIMRIFIVLFIVLSAIIALFQYKSHVAFIAQLMGISWGALAGAFLAPFLFGLYWKKTTATACIVNFAFSTAVMIANIFLQPMFPQILRSPINAGAFCMLAGIIIVPATSLVTPKMDSQQLNSIFSCYTIDGQKVKSEDSL